MGKIRTDVTNLGNKPHFDMTGRFLYYLREPTSGTISDRLAHRLVQYALRRAKESGFKFLKDWTPEVYTGNGNDRVTERFYSVSFYNGEGGRITMDGILISDRQIPDLDHGWAIAENQYLEESPTSESQESYDNS
jgi:hypothetical protein